MRPSFWWRLIIAMFVLGTARAAFAENLDHGKLRTQLIRHEGKRNKVYLDSVGIPTIGVGFNLKRAGAKTTIAAVGADYQRLLDGKDSLTELQILTLLDGDIQTAIASCQALYPNLAKLNDVRQRVLVDMTFNLGKAGLGQFKKLKQAIEAGDFARAADEMKASKWFRQVKSRGVRLEAMMRSGQDPG